LVSEKRLFGNWGWFGGQKNFQKKSVENFWTNENNFFLSSTIKKNSLIGFFKI